MKVTPEFLPKSRLFSIKLMILIFMKLRFSAFLVLFPLWCFGLDYQIEVRPVLERYCFECHGEEKQKGKLRLDTLKPEISNAETWHDALDQLNMGEMPPPKSKQPTAEELQVLTGWINGLLTDFAESKRFEKGRVSMRRLTRYEYANTMRDLLGIEMDFARELPPEPASPEGFLNNGATLEMSPSQLEVYLKAARLALKFAIPSPEPPEVIQVSQTKSALGKLPQKKDGGHIPVNPEYIIDLPKFPRVGEFEVRITAKLANPDHADYPTIEVNMGHVPGIIHVPRKLVGKIELKSEKPETFALRGRMEDFPQAGDIPFGNSGFKGMIVMLDYVDADGKALRYPDRIYAQKPPPPKKPKKGEKPKPPKEKPKPAPFGSRLEIEVLSAEFEGPILKESIVQCTDGKSEIQKFARKAFRRPVAEEDVKPFFQLLDRLLANQVPYEEAMRETFAAILVSPHFLYIAEPSDEKALTDYEIATRLSYFLWSTMPDPILFELAKQGKLKEPKILEQQVHRMLEDERAQEFVVRFADQWFGLDALKRVAVDPQKFPKFKEPMKEDFRKETQAVFAEIVHHNLSALELLDSNWTMANRNLANHYQIDSPKSRDLEKVIFKENSVRGGILGHGAFHLSGSNGIDSHPIKRAVWILDRLLDSPPMSPPPDAPELDSENPDLAKLSLKEPLEVHREKESCNNCHKGIDPWGLPLENFDALGQWRQSPDTASELPDGSKIEGVQELKQFLTTERKSWFARSAVKRLMSYALGRSLDLGDRKIIQSLSKDFAEADFRFRPLIVKLVQSDAFQGQ